ESECALAVFVTTPHGRFAAGTDLTRQSGRHQGVRRLPRRRQPAVFGKDEKLIAPLRRRAKQSTLRFVEFDRHFRTPALRTGPANPAPSLTRAPDRRGLGAGVWGGDRNAWDAADYVRGLVNDLSANGKEAATNALSRLQSDANLA